MLSKQTGDAFRLPDERKDGPYKDREAEGEKPPRLLGGYALNPDDALEAAPRNQGAGGTAPLLREVGRFRRRAKDDSVFDLGGNAADGGAGQGQGQAMGAAPSVPRTTARRRAAAARVHRFRVIKGEKKKPAE